LNQVEAPDPKALAFWSSRRTSMVSAPHKIDELGGKVDT